MIDYYPIILTSTESKSSIWLEIKNAPTHQEETYCSLYIIMHTGTWDARNMDHDLYKGPEEGFSQTMYDIPVSIFSLEKMSAKLNTTAKECIHSKDCINFTFVLKSMDNSKVFVQVSNAKSEGDLAFQIVYKKEMLRSMFQIQTSTENLIAFLGELDKKLKNLSR